jgi:hypothetical protein
MLGFAPLGQLPLGQPGSPPSIITVAAGISGGTFSRGRWRRIKEEERSRSLALVRAREAEILRRRAAASADAAAARAARDASRADEDHADGSRARRQAIIDALATLSGANRISEMIAGAAPMAVLAAQAQQARAAEQDEEEAVVRLLLLD